MVEYMLAPLESAASTSKIIIQETNKMGDEINAAFGLVVNASKSLDEMMFQETPSYSEMCPNFAPDIFSPRIGIGVSQIYRDYANQLPQVVELLETAAAGRVALKVLGDANETIVNVADYSWVVTCIISITVFITLSQLGSLAIAAYKETTCKDT